MRRMSEWREKVYLEKNVRILAKKQDKIKSAKCTGVYEMINNLLLGTYTRS